MSLGSSPREEGDDTFEQAAPDLASPIPGLMFSGPGSDGHPEEHNDLYPEGSSGYPGGLIGQHTEVRARLLVRPLKGHLLLTRVAA